MIELAGKKYARNNAELVDTLFQGPVTAAGFYRKLQNGVLFLDHQKKPFAAAVRDVTNGGCFFVNATRSENGRTRYNFSTNELTEKQLDIDGLTYSKQHDAAKAVIQQAEQMAGGPPADTPAQSPDTRRLATLSTV